MSKTLISVLRYFYFKLVIRNLHVVTTKKKIISNFKNSFFFQLNAVHTQLCLSRRFIFQQTP